MNWAFSPFLLKYSHGSFARSYWTALLKIANIPLGILMNNSAHVPLEKLSFLVMHISLSLKCTWNKVQIHSMLHGLDRTYFDVLLNVEFTWQFLLLAHVLTSFSEIHFKMSILNVCHTNRYSHSRGERTIKRNAGALCVYMYVFLFVYESARDTSVYKSNRKRKIV